MWDLDTLRYLNEQAHLRAVERANEQALESSQPIPGPVFPLAILARKLITGPPSIIALIDLLENSEMVLLFQELVREYLPENETEIMTDDVDGRIARFILHFNQRYFPLSERIDFEEYTIGDFLNEIPVDLMGFTYTDYHEFENFREGYIVMLALAENQYDDPDRGGRVPILEQTVELVGRGPVDLIPAEGWSTDDLHQMLDGTKYEDVALFADWVNAETGCMQLDANDEDYGPEAWEPHVVDRLTMEWPRVQEIQDKLYNISLWLEKDIRKNFAEVIYYLTGQKAFIIPEEQIPLPLDDNGQVNRKEVIADGNED